MAPPLLATVDASGRSLQGVVLWSAILIGLVFVAFIGYSYLRRWMARTDDLDAPTFSLSDLRRLHREGRMTDAEFEATRAQLIGAAKRATDALPPVLSRPPTRPVNPSGPTPEPPPDDAP